MMYISTSNWYLTFLSFSRHKKVVKRMSGVRGVLNYAGCFSEAAGNVDRVSGWVAGLLDWAAFTSL